MIDRKALWISGLFFAAMIAAILWRLSLLPNWSHFPLNGPGDSQSRNSLWLFVSPACLLFVASVLFARKWFVSGPEESVAPWRRWSAMMLLPYAAITAMMLAFILAHSLGFGEDLDRVAIARGVLVLMGLLLMALGNLMPKLPWLSMRLRPFQLDPWQWNRHLRMMGRLTVGLGLFVAIGGPLLSPGWFRNVFVGLWLAVLAAGITYRIKLRRKRTATP